jgi:hypothetical protein
MNLVISDTSLTNFSAKCPIKTVAGQSEITLGELTCKTKRNGTDERGRDADNKRAEPRL